MDTISPNHRQKLFVFGAFLEAMYNIGMASKMNPWLNPTKVQQHRPAKQKNMQRPGWDTFPWKISPVVFSKTRVFFVFPDSNLEMVEERSDVSVIWSGCLWCLYNLVKILAAFFFEVVDELELETYWI